MTSVVRRVATGLLVAAMLVLVGFLGAAWLGHWTFHIVQTASMAPAVPRDSLAAVAPADGRSAQVGDVVAFRLADRPGITVIHRVVERIEQGGNVFYRTKGDANAEPDVRLVPAAAVRGRVTFDLHGAGVVARNLRPPWTWLILVGGPLALLVGGEVRGRVCARRQVVTLPLDANVCSSTVGERGLGESSASVGRARAPAVGAAAHR